MFLYFLWGGFLIITKAFVVEAVAGYIRTKSYSIEAMEQREKLIREKAEAVVRANLRGTKLALYMWVLKHTRKGKGQKTFIK